jgi:Cu-processing system ATP-binding protein
VLFLDEPTAGLDPVSVEVFKDKVRKELSNGRLIVITSHVISDLEDLISEVVYMQDGKMLFHLQREDLIAKTNTTQLGKGLAQYLQML